MAAVNEHGAVAPGPGGAQVGEEDGWDPFLLRGLFMCGLCGDLFRATHTVTRTRVYACANVRCPRPLVRAEDVERLVWARYAGLNEQAAGGVPCRRRREALVDVLTGVTMGARLVDLDVTWRD